ncbi:MAG: hypothetical protein OXB88_03620 [Bacteriovoracales bacterium]|nr:hypothetical protein [Bacteriovoracales bacterium]
MKKFVFWLFLMISFETHGKGPIVFSISQDISLKDNVKPLKNFYISMGKNQGVREGVILDVFRAISQINPYEMRKRYNFKVKIGELKIVYSEDHSAIAILHSLEIGKKNLSFEVEGIMIGDSVAVKTTSK